LDTKIDDVSKREILMNKLISMANRGNLAAIKEILDRTEGKSTEFVVTEEFKPIRVLEFGDDLIDER